MKRIIVILGLVLTLCISPITNEVMAYENGTEVVEERNIFEEFYYRLVLKDTRDFYDYIMLGTFITGMLIVLVFKNTHYYTVKIERKIELPQEEMNDVIDNPKPKERNYKPRNNTTRRKPVNRKKKVDNIETSSQN